MFWLSFIFLIFAIFIFYKDYKINQEIKIKKNKNKENAEELANFILEKNKIIEEISKYKQDLEEIKKITKDLQSTSLMSFENYCRILDNKYKEKDYKYDKLLKELEENYDNAQDGYLGRIAEVKLDLDKISQTRAAAIQAQIREKEIKEQSDFFCLKIQEQELDDIKILERVKPKLHQPRILCMLIWSTYFQKPMTALCNNVLGPNTTCGIYKITNQETNECYIGQAVDIATRWKNHAKCGLGIDTPANNKLYKAMQEYGIWNFSWELLERCPSQFLNEKEKYYIDLYESYKYGYNSNAGIKNA